jgi:hypothetical protein
MINMDDNIVTSFQTRNIIRCPFFKPYRSMFRKKFYSGSLPTTIVLDKFGIMRLRHEGFANYGGKLNLQIKQLLEE